MALPKRTKAAAKKRFAKQKERAKEKEEEKELLKKKMFHIREIKKRKNRINKEKRHKHIQQLRLARKIRQRYLKKRIRVTESKLSPIQTLALFSKSKVSREAHRDYCRVTRVLATEYQTTKLKADMGKHVEYEIVGDVVKLKKVLDAVRYRLAPIPDGQKERIVIMCDKGLDTTKITLMLPDKVERPQSCYNHLILAVWHGNDSNENLMKFKGLIQELSSLNASFFVGGDLSFLASLFGMSNASSFPCIWCDFRAIKNRKIPGQLDKLDRHLYEKRTLNQFDQRLQVSTKNHEERKGVFRPYVWPLEPSKCVPPILHLKLGFGNMIYKAMEAEAQESQILCERENFAKLATQFGFYKSYKSDDMNGPKLKKFCLLRNEFRALITSPKYGLLCDCLDLFADFCKISGSVNSDMSNDEREAITDACQNLLNSMEILDLGTRSVKAHVALRHLPEFLNKNRCLGNMSEEGLESLHSIFGQVCNKIKRANKLEVLRYAAKTHAINVLLFDQGQLI